MGSPRRTKFPVVEDPSGGGSTTFFHTFFALPRSFHTNSWLQGVRWLAVSAWLPIHCLPEPGRVGTSLGTLGSYAPSLTDHGD